MIEHYSTHLTCLVDAELVLWWILLPDVDNSCCFEPESFLKGGTNRLGAEAELRVSLWGAAAGSESSRRLEVCTCTEVLVESAEACLLSLIVCPSLCALLSKALRLFSSIFRCCSVVSWLDMMMVYLAATNVNTLLTRLSELANTLNYLQTHDPCNERTINTTIS